MSRKHVFAIAVAFLLAIGTVLPATAADNASLTVTGSVVNTLVLTIGSGSLDFGDLKPDGTGTAGQEGSPFTDTSGACYVQNTPQFTMKSNVNFLGKLEYNHTSDIAVRWQHQATTGTSLETDSFTTFSECSSDGTALTLNGTDQTDTGWLGNSALGPTAGATLTDQFAAIVEWTDSGNLIFSITYTLCASSC